MLKTKLILITAILLLCSQSLVFAEQQTRTSNNRMYLEGEKDRSEIKLSEQPELVSFGPRDTGSTSKKSGAKNGCFNCSHHDFAIFDSRVGLWGDDDADGFYRALSVTFDLDNYGPGEWVYARLFLSLEGGPWNEYAITDDFYVQGISADDNYTIDTDLLSGYPTGYYDVLIEVYAADTGEFLTLSGPNEDLDLSVLSLEDADRDYYDHYEDNYYYGHGSHGGSFGLFLLSLLLLASSRVRRLRVATSK